MKNTAADFFKRTEAGELKPAQDDTTYTVEELATIKVKSVEAAKALLDERHAKRAEVIARVQKALELSIEDVSLLFG